MKYLLIGIAVFLLIVLILFNWTTGSYNNLVQLKTNVETKQGQVEVQQQRRFDLIPQLVGSVRGAMGQEQAVFKAIADARTKYAGSASGTPDKVNAANEYESAFARLLIVMENYPQLASIQRVSDLMISIEGTENRISVARERYNEEVKEYNQVRRKFPTIIMATFLGFEDIPMFKGQAGSGDAPTVNLEVK